MKGVLTVILCSIAMLTLAQKEVEVIQAEFLEYDDQIADGAQRLVGFVTLEFDDVTLSCDSAYIYQNNNFKAFNNVHVNQGDSIHLYGDLLDYKHSKKQSKLTNNVMFKDKDMTLKTDVMEYDLRSNVGRYFNGGTITSTENNNTLFSQNGSYNSDSEMFYFQKNVSLKNPEYTVLSDTLNYNNQSETAFFYGPTTISSEGSEIYCENGWYNTQSEICQFSENAVITSETRTLKGDSIYYNGQQKFGEAYRNVEIADSTEHYTISGNYGYHNQELDSSYVIGQALYVQDFDKDSLFLHADTLLAVKDSSAQNTIKAYHKVKFFKADMQGKSDSLVWLNADSLLHMFDNPIIWNEGNQMTADTISITMTDGRINQLLARKNAFLISEKGAGKYDQIKGRSLTGYFRENELYQLDVNGNGQAVYYPIEESGDSKKISGVNKIDCSDIQIFMKDKGIDRIKFIKSPKGAMLPLNSAVTADEVLSGFQWFGSERPQSSQDIFED